MTRRIICAAVKKEDRIWYGHRHTDALRAMDNELSYSLSRRQIMEDPIPVRQGFVTNEGYFVDRDEAFTIATQESKQCESIKSREDDRLYSEDLY